MTNPVLFGNHLALEADRLDHTIPGTRDAPGPCAASRAIAMAHIAMADTCSELGADYHPWMKHAPHSGGKGGSAISRNAAVAAAAHGVIAGIYKRRHADHQKALDRYIASLTEQGVAEGQEFGALIAEDVLSSRASDPASAGQLIRSTYGMPPGHRPEIHDVDPFHPGQMFYGEAWADELKAPFGLASLTEVEVLPVGEIPRSEIDKDIVEVGQFGGIGNSQRSQDQEDVGVFWSYDGSSGLGTPPRLYNQFVLAVLAHDSHPEDVDQLARLLALVNLAMADAGIVAWRGKYRDDVSRPVRFLNKDSFDASGKPLPGRHFWEPLGAQASMGPGTTPADGISALGLGFAPPALSQRKDFTPNFASYPSGHATFGAAALHALRLLRKNGDKIGPDFSFTSDELNGVTKDSRGYTRPNRPRNYPTIAEAIRENSESRIWLGVHWRYDSKYGEVAGEKVAKAIVDRQYRPR